MTFSPQNLYIFRDRFRTLQRKADSLKKTLFSVIVPQHQQIVNWLKTQPYVDPEGIAFYDLFYGRKTAMRVTAVVTDYCLSICSADFNEWVWKNASTRSPYSYVWTVITRSLNSIWGARSTTRKWPLSSHLGRSWWSGWGHFDGVALMGPLATSLAKSGISTPRSLGFRNAVKSSDLRAPMPLTVKQTSICCIGILTGRRLNIVITN